MSHKIGEDRHTEQKRHGTNQPLSITAWIEISEAYGRKRSHRKINNYNSHSRIRDLFDIKFIQNESQKVFVVSSITEWIFKVAGKLYLNYPKHAQEEAYRRNNQNKLYSFKCLSDHQLLLNIGMIRNLIFSDFMIILYFGHKSLFQEISQTLHEIGDIKNAEAFNKSHDFNGVKQAVEIFL